MLNKISLKARALRYLATREHSRKEMAGKLARYADDADEVDAVLDWLQKQGYLSEARFTEALVRQRATMYGRNRILHELQNRGIEGDALQEAKQALAEGEVERARNVWEKKFGSLPENQHDRAKQMRFMQQRGFSLETVRKIWKQDTD